MTGASVVVPAGGRKRLHLLEATLRHMRRCAGVDQLIVSEVGAEPVALDAARSWGADYVFTQSARAFERARAMNAGFRLAHCPDILYCDGDLVFGEAFLPRALAEFRASGFDAFLPFSTMEYLDEARTAEVLAGTRQPTECVPLRVLGPLGGGLPGAMGMVRASFLARHGGMIEGFRGWGFEDNAWVHKVWVLGRIDATARTDQPVWHLFHPDSGSFSAAANRRAGLSNPEFESNVALFREIEAIRDPVEMSRRFPPLPTEPPPWPPSSGIVFAVMAGGTKPAAAQHAKAWAERLGHAYGMTPGLVHMDAGDTAGPLAGVTADALVGFADTADGAAALLATGRLSILVPGDTVDPVVLRATPGERPWVLARDPAMLALWEGRGARVWHRPWDEGGTPDAAVAPVITQPLSLVLGAPRVWRVRITLDRGTLPHGATDRPAFWYVALHDADGSLIARHDADRPELHRALSQPGDEVVLEREIRAPRPPARWTVQPTDRRRQWLQTLSGAVDAYTRMID
jgi:hypothetical protein